jgi:hypothetical protein
MPQLRSYHLKDPLECAHEIAMLEQSFMRKEYRYICKECGRKTNWYLAQKAARTAFQITMNKGSKSPKYEGSLI